MALVVTGLMNKQIAGEIGISEITVKVPSRSGDAKDAGLIPGRPGADG
jgi:FixJ family two-component response regulator